MHVHLRLNLINLRCEHSALELWALSYCQNNHACRTCVNNDHVLDLHAIIYWKVSKKNFMLNASAQCTFDIICLSSDIWDWALSNCRDQCKFQSEYSCLNCERPVLATAITNVIQENSFPKWHTCGCERSVLAMAITNVVQEYSCLKWHTGRSERSYHKI